MTVVIRPGEASLADWRAIWDGAPLAVDPSSHAAVAASAACPRRRRRSRAWKTACIGPTGRPRTRARDRTTPAANSGVDGAGVPECVAGYKPQSRATCTVAKCDCIRSNTPAVSFGGSDGCVKGTCSSSGKPK